MDRQENYALRDLRYRQLAAASGGGSKPATKAINKLFAAAESKHKVTAGPRNRDAELLESLRREAAERSGRGT